MGELNQPIDQLLATKILCFFPALSGPMFLLALQTATTHISRRSNECLTTLSNSMVCHKDFAICVLQLPNQLIGQLSQCCGLLNLPMADSVNLASKRDYKLEVNMGDSSAGPYQWECFQDQLDTATVKID